MKFYTVKISFLIVITLSAASLFSSGCGTSSEAVRAKQYSSLISSIDKKFDDPRFSDAFWGVEIKSLRTGKIWYERNSDKLFMPASNEKLPTAASAFMLLGPEFKFQTDLYASGEVMDSVLNGNLIVFGDGDPTLYTRFYDDPRDVFFAWADSLKDMGIKKITGNIIGDGRAFDNDTLGFGWSYDGLDAWYSAEVSALQLNENYVDIKITPPQTISGEVKIEPNLPSRYYSIKNEITVIDTGRARLFVSRQCGTNEIILAGTVKAGSRTVIESPTITNPVLFYVTVLKEVLAQSGIEVDGGPVNAAQAENTDYSRSDLKLLNAHYSAPLKDIIKVMLKRSQNLYAETLARAIGLKENGKGTFAAGKKYVAQVLQQFGIEPGTYRYMDGSGLSRYDYISPDEIVKILTAMYDGPYRDLWYDALPIAGVDGTLRNRMKGTKAEDNVHAKTGTISNVRSLSGYVTTAEGEPLVFSFIVNSHLANSLATEEVTDSVAAMLAAF